MEHFGLTVYSYDTSCKHLAFRNASQSDKAKSQATFNPGSTAWDTYVTRRTIGRSAREQWM